MPSQLRENPSTKATTEGRGVMGPGEVTPHTQLPLAWEHSGCLFKTPASRPQYCTEMQMLVGVQGVVRPWGFSPLRVLVLTGG